MRLRVLGTAAGGGLPQWNCACASCSRARSAGPAAWRSQECLAVSVSPGAWYLVNASPDLRSQLLAVPGLAPAPGSRRSPLRGVLLTDGELDHTTGLLALREGAELDIHAPDAVVASLTEHFPLRRLLDPYATVRWHPLDASDGGELLLDDGGLRVTALPLSDKHPRYAAESARPGPWVVALRFEDVATGGAVVYAPCLAAWPDGFEKFAADAAYLLLDGTFWREDELARATGHPGVRGALSTGHPGVRGALAMGHLPISGDGGTLARLRPAGSPRYLYTHLNNTNPIADPASPEHAELIAAGARVAQDGMELTL
jgi:pyrroloquinoline quinone biosynthesis protein B